MAAFLRTWDYPAKAAARAAVAAARSASGSARRAGQSALWARASAERAYGDAQEAYEAYTSAYAAAVGAGKDRDAAIADAQAAHDQVLRRVRAAQNHAAVLLLEQCNAPLVDHDECVQNATAIILTPERVAAINGAFCQNYYNPGGCIRRRWMCGTTSTSWRGG